MWHLYVDAKKCKNLPIFDKVMTYLAKYNFVILAEVYRSVAILLANRFEI
jgi:hypothetical protein